MCVRQCSLAEQNLGVCHVWCLAASDESDDATRRVFMMSKEAVGLGIGMGVGWGMVLWARRLSRSCRWRMRRDEETLRTKVAAMVEQWRKDGFEYEAPLPALEAGTDARMLRIEVIEEDGRVGEVVLRGADTDEATALGEEVEYAGVTIRVPPSGDETNEDSRLRVYSVPIPRVALHSTGLVLQASLFDPPWVVDPGEDDGGVVWSTQVDNFAVSSAGGPVPLATLERARDMMDAMLSGAPSWLLHRLQNGSLAVIAADGVSTDVGAHAHLRGVETFDGRDFDAGTRGLGGTLLIPVTSVGQENVERRGEGKDGYHQESILVHEFAHHVMEVGLKDTVVEDAILDAFAAAKTRPDLDQECYMLCNPAEYWAEGVQAWFHATVRTDVNSGINTRQRVWDQDRSLAIILSLVFGSDDEQSDDLIRWG